MPSTEPTPAVTRSLTGGISIAIVTFAAAEGLLEAAVESVLDTTGELTCPVAVEVVDNGTEAARRLAHFGDRITVITTGNNGGFAAAVNIGFRRGIQRGARFVACLNDDVVVTKGWLIELVGALDADGGLGGVQPLLLNPSTGLIDSAGVSIDRYGAGSDLLRDEPADAAQPAEVVALTGGAMVVRSAVLAEVGYLDERFFLYYEDVEWCQRAGAAGWRFAVVPGAVAYHRGSATTAALGDRLVMLQDRNRLWNTAIHGDSRQIVSALSLSVRRLRHRPYRAHLRALGGGAFGMTTRLAGRAQGRMLDSKKRRANSQR